MLQDMPNMLPTQLEAPSAGSGEGHRLASLALLFQGRVKSSNTLAASREDELEKYDTHIFPRFPSLISIASIRTL